MFTGIVQEVGSIRDRIAAHRAIRFSFAAPSVAQRLAPGDSVACDGVCLTVETRDASGFTVTAVPETLDKTALGSWTIGGAVNLETALTPATPMGGHFVLGHADGVCEVTAVRALAEGEGREITVRLPEAFLPYCVYKGSLTLSGVSLTIAAVDGDLLRFAIIPHTLSATTLGGAKPGSRLNFEADILAKYAEKLLGARAAGGHGDPAPQHALDGETLGKWGYEVP